MKNKICFLVFVLSFSVNSFCQPKVALDVDSMIVLSDIHFNPLYDSSLTDELLHSDYKQWDSIFKKSSITKFSYYREDANYSLFIAMLDKIKEVYPSPEYMIISGDFLCHDSFLGKYNSDSSLKNNMIRFIAKKLKDVFPATVILPAIGNNDSYVHNSINPNDPFLLMFANAWVPLLHFTNEADSVGFINQFSKGGYYSYGFKNSRNKIVLLNTVFFSSEYKGPDNAGSEEKNWLGEALNKHENVWTASHLPPGTDMYKLANKSSAAEMCNSNFEGFFCELLKKNASHIQANFAGHTHMNDFRLVADSTGKAISFFHIIPAVSSVYHNNPAFQIINYSKESMELLDYTTHYLDAGNGNQWESYNFKSDFQLDKINAATLQGLVKNMQSDSAHLNNFINNYNVHSIKSNDAKKLYANDAVKFFSHFFINPD